VEGVFFGAGRAVWRIEEEGVDVEGEGDGVEGGLVEEGRREVAETELLCCGGGRTGARVEGYGEEVLHGGLCGGQRGRAGTGGTYTEDAEGVLGGLAEEGAEGEGGGVGLGGGGLGGREGEDAVEEGLGVDAVGRGWTARGRRAHSPLEDVEDLLCVGGLDWDIGGELEALELPVVAGLLFYAGLLGRRVPVRRALALFCGLSCAFWVQLRR
jgi:hypothetical protein